MGSSTASTISITTTPIATISSGSSRVARAMARRDTSLLSCLAARDSMSGSWPVCSPSRANIESSPGKRFFCAKAEASGAPSRTSTNASSASVRMAWLDSVSAAACKAFKIGTPAATSIASVLAKRAVLKLRESLPRMGRLSQAASNFSRNRGFDKAQRARPAITTIAISISQM